MLANSPQELLPWIILEHRPPTGGAAEVVLWQLAASPPASAGQALQSAPAAAAPGDAFPAIALFSQSSAADEYRQQHCSADARVVRLDSLQTVRLLVAAYQQGVRYAALDPSPLGTRQVFVLRQVLVAAQRELAALKSAERSNQ